MSVRYAALGALAILVLVLGVYLFLEVRSTPAAAQGPVASGESGSPRPSQATHRSGVDAVGSHDAVATGTTGDDGSASPAADRFKRRAGKPGSELARDPEIVPAPTDDPSKSPKDKEFDQKLDAVMSEANKAYDRGDFDDAKVFAQKVLAKNPGNVRMLRILVSASCIDGDSTEAQKRYLELPRRPRADADAV